MKKAKSDRKQKGELVAKFGQVPAKEEIFTRIKESQERLVRSLAGALATAPEDPQIRGQLLEAIEKATKLRTKLYGMMGEIPPRISLSSPDSEERLSNESNN